MQITLPSVGGGGLSAIDSPIKRFINYNINVTNDINWRDSGKPVPQQTDRIVLPHGRYIITRAHSGSNTMTSTNTNRIEKYSGVIKNGTFPHHVNAPSSTGFHVGTSSTILIDGEYIGDLAGEFASLVSSGAQRGRDTGLFVEGQLTIRIGARNLSNYYLGAPGQIGSIPYSVFGFSAIEVA